MMGQSWAQSVPTISLRVFSMHTVNEDVRCTNHFPDAPLIQLIADRAATVNEVRVVAYTQSGHNRLYDYNVPVYVEPNSQHYARSSHTDNYSFDGVNWLNVGTRDDETAICWQDDTLATGDSVVEVFLVNGSGYRVNPNMNRGTFTITDDDVCGTPSSIMDAGGTLYMPMGGNMNRTCVCRTRRSAATLYPGSVPSITHNIDDYYVTINGNRSLRSSRDQSNYCPESPYQGPGN